MPDPIGRLPAASGVAGARFQAGERRPLDDLALERLPMRLGVDRAV